MSILTDAINKKITWATAAQEIEAWGANIVKSFLNDPTVVATTGAVVSDLKQQASDALTLADTLAGPIITSGASAIEGAADAAFSAYFGSFAPIASKAAHDSVDRIAAGLKALIDAKTVEFKAAMQPAQAKQ